MARRRKTTTRRRAAPRRRAMARSAPRRRSTRRSGGRSFGGLLPLSMRETGVSFATGAVTPWANNLVAPYTDSYLNWAGNYKNEVRTAAIGILVHKFAPAGIARDMGKEMVRFAALSAGQDFGAGLTNGTTGGSMSGSGIIQA